MRRMVLKYREAEKIIKKVNEKITLNADLFDLEEKLRRQMSANTARQSFLLIRKIPESLRMYPTERSAG